MAGHDAVVSACNPGWSEPHIHDLFLQGSQALLDGVKPAGVQRLLVVGGAGSLYVAPGVQLVGMPGLPAEHRQGALAAREFPNRRRPEGALDWRVVSPPIALAPDERTGQYRLGADDLRPGLGYAPAGISVADRAMAIVDEIEQPWHRRRRFSVARQEAITIASDWRTGPWRGAGLGQTGACGSV